MRRDHFFDWHGFKYAAKVLVLCIIAGTLGRYSLLYAAQPHSSAPSLVLIQETRPAPGKSLSLTLSTTTSTHIINTLAIADAVPPTGKFIAADLQSMVLTLYQDGAAIAKYPIRAKAEIGSPYETPAGFYTVLKKESDHFNNVEQIDLPWSVQFSANYFIHGLPYGIDGAPVSASYTGGGIQLSTGDARDVYEFAKASTNIFVFDPTSTALASLTLDAIPVPSVSAASYLVADIDTGDVFLEQNVENPLPLASTQLMTALVANEIIPIDAKIGNARPSDMPGFLDWMNAKARSLDMQSTHFSDAVSTSTENISVPDDLFRLASYLAHKKPFVLETVVTEDLNTSVVSLPIDGRERRVAVIVLESLNYATDAQALTDWFTQSALQGADLKNTACTTCAVPAPYRKIQR